MSLNRIKSYRDFKSGDLGQVLEFTDLFEKTVPE